MIIVAFFDVIGVASIMPFIATINNTELINSNKWLRFIYTNLHFSNYLYFQLFLGCLFFLFLIFSIFLKAYSSYKQLRFTSFKEFVLSKRLIEGYLNQPYIWFLNKHSSELGNNILAEVNQVVGTAIIPLFNFISQLLVSVFLFSFLLFIDYKLALTVSFVLSFSYFIIYLYIKKKVNKLGSERVETNAGRFKIVHESFSGIKELKISGYEKTYVSQFSKYAEKYASVNAKIQIVVQIPRFAIEGVAFGGLILILLFLLNTKANLISSLPIIALYTMAGYRLMPALQQVYASLIQLKSAKFSLKLISDSLNLVTKNYNSYKDENIINFKSFIELNNVDFSYPNSDNPTLKKINLTIPSLSTVGIVGQSGSGKTTIIDLLLGLLQPQNGNLIVDNILINNLNTRSYQKNIGYVPQQIFLTDNSIASNIAFGINVDQINFEQVVKVAKIANLHDFIVNNMQYGYDTKIGERGVRLSGGQRQRIAIARALYHDPQLLVLDEATSALDNVSEHIVMEAISNLSGKITIIIVAHRLSTIKKCNNIFVIDKGEIIGEGTYEYLTKNNYNFNKFLRPNE